jgi:hypothetical protein
MGYFLFINASFPLNILKLKKKPGPPMSTEQGGPTKNQQKL